MKKSIQDLKESLRKKEEKQQRLHEQEETVKKDIRVLRYLNLRITYRCFCRWLCTRYEFESRYHDRHKLSPCTILGYFKRERGG